MKLEIQKIRLDELENFVESETYKLLSTVPITPDRAKSYIKNPNARPDDVVLYLGFIENNLLAFRTLFAGKINTNNLQIHFAWCSGNWVHPEFRRLGFSEQLLKEAYSDWDKKLMFTNYAPNSEKLYLKTGWFQAINKFDGVRGYLFPKTRKLIARANTNKISKFAYLILDVLISIISSFRVLFFINKQNNNIRFETISTPDKQCYEFNNKDNFKFLFNREEKELNWIFQFPWLSLSDNFLIQKYPFSSFSKSFNYQTVKIFAENKFEGYFLFSVREGHLKTLYFNIQKGFEKEIALFLKQFCAENKIEIITVYNSTLAKQFFEQKFPFLHVKKYGQKIYSSFEINYNSEYQFQDGDGDVIFT